MAPRTRQKNLHLPPRMRVSTSGMHYYDHGPGSDGKRHWEPLCRNLAEAKLKWAQIETERNEVPISSNTVAAILDYYKREHIPKLAERTQKDRKAHVVTLTRTFGHMAPAKVRAQDVAAYLEAHKSPVSANREITTLSVAFKKAMRIGMCHHNPCEGVERNEEAPRDRYVTDAEFLAIKEIVDPWMQAVMDLAYFTGMRLGDLLRLERSQLQPDGIYMRQGKTKQRMVVERTPALNEVLARLSSERKVSGMARVVCTRKGEGYTVSGFGSMWRRIIVKAHKQNLIAERFTFHDIRAKSATDAEDQGKDPQRLMGHTTRRQTETYLRSRKAIRVKPVEPRRR